MSASRAAAPAIAAIFMAAFVAGGEGAARANPARTFLAEAFGLTAGDFARLDRGQVFSRTLPATDSREVATLGVVRVSMTPEFYVDQLGDIAELKRDEAILQIGTFGNPPSLRDVDGLTLDEADVRSLRGCRIGDCGVQLSADAITRFREEIDWDSRDAAHRANGLLRQILVEYVAQYMTTGRAASMTYADGPEPLDLWGEFVSLAAAAEDGGWRQFPGLQQHLFHYPAKPAQNTTDLVYWSKERIGRKGVASVTHLAIARVDRGSPADYAVASRQIYGMHYYDASLGLTILLRDRSSPSPATYLAYVNRSRVDVFRGLFGGLVRKIVTGRARSTVADQLEGLQRTLESRFCRTGTC